MSESLAFDHVLPYRRIPGGRAAAPVLEVGLIGPDGEERALAVLDTGAEYCLFNGQRAATLGIALRNGREVRLPGLAGGHLPARLHPVTLDIEGHRFSCTVAFSLAPLSREILGRHSLFEQVTFAVREHYQSIYFSPRP